jgi:hypothetical protein
MVCFPFTEESRGKCLYSQGIITFRESHGWRNRVENSYFRPLHHDVGELRRASALGVHSNQDLAQALERLQLSGVLNVGTTT